MTGYKLYYFDARGRAEPIRWLLALGHQDYEDIRFEWDENWMAMKKDMPFGQVPVLEIDGVKYAQSFPICRYLAGLYGLTGDTPEQEARIDMFADTINDVRNPFRAIVMEKDPQKKQTLLEKYRDEDLPRYLANFEKHLISNAGGDGFFVGSKMSYADIIITHYINPKTGYKKFLGFEHTLDKYPKLKALTDRVESQPEIKRWIEQRPDTDA